MILWYDHKISNDILWDFGVYLKERIGVWKNV